jgi:rhodanese-related sulfurtransferase
MSNSTTTAEQLLSLALQRGQEQNLPYAGLLTPTETAQLIESNPRAMLVDVRTKAEVDWVGTVALDASRWMHIEWNSYPGGARNEKFAEQLLTIQDKQTPILFLCRSGARSHQAALLARELGYENAINILEGFEGDKNELQHRGQTNGWKAAGLPWKQG